ncbi:MAG: hypothetical protein KDA58_09060 [Planctomycetaceae bacterium]|nr:hypothetical protein [Planctomycetaceae bacterium]
MLASVCGLAVWMTGCSSAQTSNTARTSTEQLLVSNAIDQSLNKIDFTPFGGHAVFLSDTYVDCVDKNYVIGSVRHRILAAGARLVDKPEDAEVVLEMRSGGVGTATSEAFVGMPEIALPGMLTLPEVRLLERKQQHGLAKLGMVAYDPRTKEILGNGGTSLSKSDDSNWYVMGMGPFQNGTVREEVSTSTSGYAATVRNRLPVQVAFQEPINRVEGIAVEPPAPEAAPQGTAGVEPAWYRQ